MHTRRKNSGATLVEMLVTSVITVMAIGTAGSVWLAGATSWYQGVGKIDAEMQSKGAVKMICTELAESMDAVVDANGQGVTFHKPGKDGNGDYLTDVTGQPTSDGIDRRIYLDSGKLIYNTGNGLRTLARNVITTDPLSAGGNQPYKIFTPGAGAITRQVTVMVVTQTTGAKQQAVKARKRETVFLRNIYDTTR